MQLALTIDCGHYAARALLDIGERRAIDGYLPPRVLFEREQVIVAVHNINQLQATIFYW